MSEQKKQFQVWAEAALSVVGINGMADKQVIPTWPAGIEGPELTVGAVRAALAALSHAEGEAPNIYWVLFDATSDKKYIKKLADDGSLLFYDTEDEAMHARRLYPGTDYQRVEYYTHPAPQVAVPEGWMWFPVEAWAFLAGEGPLGGVHFGDDVYDDKTGRRKPFWWRSHIRAMLAAAPTAPAGESECCRSQPCKRPGIGPCDTPAAKQPVSNPDGLSDEPVPWPKKEDITEDMRAGFERLYRAKAERDGRTLERNDQGAYAHLTVDADWIFYQRAWADALEATAPDEREVAARALEDFRTGPLRSACLSHGWDTESDAYIVDRMLDEEASLLRAGKEGE